MLKKDNYMNELEMNSLMKSIEDQCESLKKDLGDPSKFTTKDDWKKMYYIKESGD